MDQTLTQRAEQALAWRIAEWNDTPEHLRSSRSIAEIDLVHDLLAEIARLEQALTEKAQAFESWRSIDPVPLVFRPLVATTALQRNDAIARAEAAEQALTAYSFTISPIHEGEENDGPLESTDLFLTGPNLSLLINVKVDSSLTYAGHVGTQKRHGTIHPEAGQALTAAQEENGKLQVSYSAAQEERTWRPIETAPKDGTQFLVFWDHSLIGKREIEIVSGWNEYQEILGYGEPPATAWMPLPDPPAEEEIARLRAQGGDPVDGPSSRS